MNETSRSRKRSSSGPGSEPTSSSTTASGATCLLSHQVVVDLIGATTTKTGLKVYAHLDKRVYDKGREVTDHEMQSLRIKRDAFRGEWNYTIRPRSKM